MAGLIRDLIGRVLTRPGRVQGIFSCAGQRAVRVSSTAAFIALLTGISAGGCTFQDRYRLPGGEDPGLSVTMDVSSLATQTALAAGEQDRPASSPFPETETRVPATLTTAPTETAVPATPANTGSSSLPRKEAEISFRPGGTMAVVEGELRGGETHSYILRAMRGQTMILSVSSDHQDVYLGLEGLDGGQQLLSLSEASSSAAVVLPETQDYAISLYASQADTVYFLRIEVPAVIEAAVEEGPAVVEGYLDTLALSSPYDTRVRYLIEVEKGQKLKVDLEMPGSDDFTLAMYGQKDGQPYLKNVRAASIDFEAPITQGYYLDVHSRKSAAFTLVVEVY